MTDTAAPVVRRAILDLLNDVGGELNHDVLTMNLTQLGHPVARRDVLAALEFLAAEHLVATERLGNYTVARILEDGRDLAEGRLRNVAGVHRFKTGD
jgi:DNA-binding transcriptional ArsR family regulator